MPSASAHVATDHQLLACLAPLDLQPPGQVAVSRGRLCTPSQRDQRRLITVAQYNRAAVGRVEHLAAAIDAACV